MVLELFLPLMIIALIAMMLLQGSRQRKAMRALQDLQNSLVAGDRVLTTSGLYATVVSTGVETLVLEVAPGVHTEWDRRVIREKVPDPAAPDSRTSPTDQ